MGIRGRMNQMQNRANALMAKAEWTLDDAKESLAMGVELIEMVKGGVAIGLQIDEHAIRTVAHRILKGEGGMLPGRLVLDFEYSEYPPESCEFVGGKYNGKRFKLTDEQRKFKIISLKGYMSDLPEQYAWNGTLFEYAGNEQVVELEEA